MWIKIPQTANYRFYYYNKSINKHSSNYWKFNYNAVYWKKNAKDDYRYGIYFICG